MGRVESGEGIESAARPLSIAYTSPYLQVESGEGIESFCSVSSSIFDFAPVESGEGIESSTL